MASIAIIGPGAIGASVAAVLARAGHAVTLCARGPVPGLRIDGPDGRSEAAPPVWTDPAAARPVDWALVCTKAYEVAGAAAWLPPLTGPGTRIAVLQNGVEHRARFAGLVAPQALVPVIVDIPAERTGPGRVTVHRWGALTAPDDPAGRAFAALFAGTPVAAGTSADWLTVAWRKLAINSCGLVLTLIDRPFGASHLPGVAAALRMLADECAAVGRAEGADLPPDTADAVVAYYQAQAPGLRNSLHTDLRTGRPLELDARDGVVVRLGETHGVPTPAHRLLIGLVEAVAEQGSTTSAQGPRNNG